MYQLLFALAGNINMYPLKEVVIFVCIISVNFFYSFGPLRFSLRHVLPTFRLSYNSRSEMRPDPR